MTARPAIGRAAFDLLTLGRRVAAELAAEAVDTSTALSMADRFALAALSLAVEAEASRRAGAEPLTERASAWLAEQLARIERGTFPTHATPLPAAG